MENKYKKERKYYWKNREEINFKRRLKYAYQKGKISEEEYYQQLNKDRGDDNDEA